MLYGQPRYLEYTARLIKEEFSISGCDVDFFCHFWNHLEELQPETGIGWTTKNEEGYPIYNIKYVQKEEVENWAKPLDPKKIVVQDKDAAHEISNSLVTVFRNMTNDGLGFEKIKEITDSEDTALNPPYLFNEISQYYSIQKASELISKYEEENNFKYDVVIRTRTDLAYLNRDCYETYEEYQRKKIEYYIEPITEYEYQEGECGVVCGSDIFLLIGNTVGTSTLRKEDSILGIDAMKCLDGTHFMYPCVHEMDQRIVFDKANIKYGEKLHFKDWIMVADSDGSRIAWQNILAIYISCFTEEITRFIQGKELLMRYGCSGEIINGLSIIYNSLSTKWIKQPFRGILIRERLERHGWDEKNGRWKHPAHIEKGSHEEMKKRIIESYMSLFS